MIIANMIAATISNGNIIFPVTNTVVDPSAPPIIPMAADSDDNEKQMPIMITITPTMPIAANIFFIDTP